LAVAFTGIYAEYAEPHADLSWQLVHRKSTFGWESGGEQGVNPAYRGPARKPGTIGGLPPASLCEAFHSTSTDSRLPAAVAKRPRPRPIAQ
jgi:hypothetical protein